MENIIRLCTHCYNTTSHELIADGYTKKIIGDRKEENSKDFTYFFVKCNTCGEHSLLGCFNDNAGENPKPADIMIFFPKLHSLDSSVPSKIRLVYDDATKIKNNHPNAYATQIRRALEYLCEDKKAKGKDLAGQLNSLADIGIIPSVLGEMTTIIRLLGNLGAHANEGNVTLSDTVDIDDFFRFLIEYVYVAPAKLEKIRLNIDWPSLLSKYQDLVYKIQDVLMEIEPITPYELDYYDERGSSQPYEYKRETTLIIKKLKTFNSKAEFSDYVHEDYFSFYHPLREEEFINSIWDLWNNHKNNSI